MNPHSSNKGQQKPEIDDIFMKFDKLLKENAEQMQGNSDQILCKNFPLDSFIENLTDSEIQCLLDWGDKLKVTNFHNTKGGTPLQVGPRQKNPNDSDLSFTESPSSSEFRQDMVTGDPQDPKKSSEGHLNVNGSHNDIQNAEAIGKKPSEPPESTPSSNVSYYHTVSQSYFKTKKIELDLRKVTPGKVEFLNQQNKKPERTSHAVEKSLIETEVKKPRYRFSGPDMCTLETPERVNSKNDSKAYLWRDDLNQTSNSVQSLNNENTKSEKTCKQRGQKKRQLSSVSNTRHKEPAKLSSSVTFTQIKDKWKSYWDNYTRHQTRNKDSLDVSEEDMGLDDYVMDCPFEDLLSTSYQVSHKNLPKNDTQSNISNVGEYPFMTLIPKTSPRRNEMQGSDHQNDFDHKVFEGGTKVSLDHQFEEEYEERRNEPTGLFYTDVPMKKDNNDGIQNRRIREYNGQDDVFMRELDTKEEYPLYSGKLQDMSESEIESSSDKDNELINPREPVQNKGFSANSTALCVLTLGQINELEQKTHYTRMDQFRNTRFKLNMIQSQLRGLSLQLQNFVDVPINRQLQDKLNDLYDTVKDLKQQEKKLEEMLQKLANKQSNNYKDVLPIPVLGPNEKPLDKTFKNIPVFSPKSNIEFAYVWSLIVNRGQPKGLNAKAYKEILQEKLRGESLIYLCEFEDKPLHQIIEVLYN